MCEDTSLLAFWPAILVSKCICQEKEASISLALVKYHCNEVPKSDKPDSAQSPRRYFLEKSKLFLWL